MSFLIRNRRLMLQIFENPILCLNLADRLILHIQFQNACWEIPNPFRSAPYRCRLRVFTKRFLVRRRSAQPSRKHDNYRVWGFPISAQMYIRLHCLRVLWSLSTYPPILKIILQARPSVFKFNLKRTVIFCSGGFCVCNRRKQGKLVPSRNFWIWFFTNPTSKTLVGFLPNPIFRTRMRWFRTLTDAE